MKFGVCSDFDALGLRVCLRVFVSGREPSLVAVMCGRVVPVCASGDRRRNVACVLDCAEVRGLPARRIKSTSNKVVSR